VRPTTDCRLLRIQAANAYRVATGDGAVVSLMFQYCWPARRHVGVAACVISLFILSPVLFAGCGLFGSDEPAPQVVEPPETTTSGDEATTTVESEQTTQQQNQPTQAVAVTTSPSEDEEQQAQTTTVSTASEEQADPDIYIVQPGDTLAQIADRLGVRMDDLITLNGIQDPDLIQVGQELQIPSVEPSVDAVSSSDDAQPASSEEADEQEQADAAEQSDLPDVELPTVAVPAATPTRVAYSQFPQPGPDQTTDTIPDAPSNFLQYGAAALPWLHGVYEIEEIIELFKAWPMPALAVGNDRIVLIDTQEQGAFSVSIVYTNPNSFGAVVPYSNLVVYDPAPGDWSRYRIAYDHAQAYAREVQGIQQLSDDDMTGDEFRDLTFREITCDDSGCVSSFYVLASTGDGYRVITGVDAQVAEVSAIAIEDVTGDGIPDISVDGLAIDETPAARHTFIFTAQGDNLVESMRILLDSDDSGETANEESEEGSAEG